MERASILLFLSCSLVAAIHAGDLETCARNYKKVGCFADKSDQSSNMLIYDRYGIQWKNIKAYMHSLACKCEKAARNSKKYAGFAIHFWGECYGKTQAQIDAVNGKSQSLECTGDQKYDGCAADDKECAGHAYTDFVFELTPKNTDVVQTMQFCSEEATNITCREGTRVEVTAAAYGERTSKECREPLSVGWQSICGNMTAYSLRLLKEHCRKSSVCSVTWKSSESDYCKNVEKYLMISYKCQG